MAKRRFGIVILLLCFCLCMLPCYVQAVSTTEAKEPISTQQDCSLTIHYRCDGAGLSGESVKLYKVAQVSEDYQYTLTSSFAASELVLNGIQTNGEWDVIRSTLEAYILANNCEPIFTVVTDEAGAACFESLKPGLYLVSSVRGMDCSFDPALVTLPGLETDGRWNYRMVVTAKPEMLPPVEPGKEIEFKVVKLWKGDEGRVDRPKYIEVEIFRDGTSYENVTLSVENNWSYSWSAKDDGADWKVVERNVPSGYIMTAQQRDTTFVITNTRPDQPNPSTPQTGDTANILLYTVLLFVSGTVLIILAITGKRKRHEETN